MNASKINAQLAALGLRARLRRGAGYYYWHDDRGQVVPDAESVYVYRASDLPIEQWVSLAREVDRLIEQVRGTDTLLPFLSIPPHAGRDTLFTLLAEVRRRRRELAFADRRQRFAEVLGPVIRLPDYRALLLRRENALEALLGLDATGGAQ